MFFILLLPSITYAEIDYDCSNYCKKNALGEEDCKKICTSSTHTMSTTETHTQPTVEEIANKRIGEARYFSSQAAEANDDKVFLDRTIKAFESCKKIEDGEAGKEGQCIKELVTYNLWFFSSERQSITYKQKYSLVEKAIAEVFLSRDMQQYARFYLCYNNFDGSSPDFKKAYSLLTTFSDNFDRSELIKMYDYVASSLPNKFTFPSLTYSEYPFLTSKDLSKVYKYESQQAAIDGCKKCEDFGFTFNFLYCKELCVASYITEGLNKRGPDWQYYSESYGSGHFEIYLFNTAKIQRRSINNVRVWRRSEPFIEKYEDIRSYEQTKDFSCRLTLDQIDCVNADIIILTMIDYDSNGKILNLYNMPYSSKKTAIVPGSVEDILFNIICKTKKGK